MSVTRAAAAAAAAFELTVATSCVMENTLYMTYMLKVSQHDACGYCVIHCHKKTQGDGDVTRHNCYNQTHNDGAVAHRM